MKLQWTLALRELRIHPQRTVLVVAALALGLWGVGTPLISRSILKPDLAANFDRTRAPHVILRSADFGRLDLTALRARAGVQSAALRDFSLHRVEVRPDTWLPLYLYGVDDFETSPIGRLLPQRGAAVPPPGTVLVERDGLKVSSFSVGSAPRIRVDGRITRMPISGVTYDASQAPATQDAFIYAYADRTTYEALSGRPTGQRLILRLDGVRSAQDVRAATEQLTRDLAAQGVAIASTEFPRFEQHPHQWQLNTLLFLITAIGLLAFAMAAVLVSQVMRAILTGQVRQVGVLKAIGATRGQVFRLFLVMVSSMGIAAGVLGIPLAVISGRLFAAFVAATLNFDVLTTTIPTVALALLAVFSLVLPLLFSLPTLLRGMRLPVKQALSDFGSPPPAASPGKSSLPLPLRLALRNVLRDRRRLFVTVLSMALGVAIFATGFNVRASLWQLLSNVSHELSYDVQVVLEAPLSRDRALEPFGAVPHVARIETWSGGQGELQSRLVSTREGVGVVALPLSTALLRLQPYEGRWLASSTDDLEVVLNQQAWLAYGRPALGSRLAMVVGEQSAEVVVVGLVQQFEKAKLYVDLEAYDARFNPRHRVTTLLFVAERKGYQDVLALKRDLERAVAGSGLPVLYVMSHAERVRIIYEHLNIVLAALLILSTLVLIVSAIGNAAAAGIDVLARTRELGVMRAIGATPRAIARLLRLEGLLISGMAIGLGLILAAPLTWRAATFFGDLMLGEGSRLEPAFSLLGLAVTTVATFGFGLLASSLPSRAALRVSTRAALAYE
jgi:putative ABC transport system permease protein